MESFLAPVLHSSADLTPGVVDQNVVGEGSRAYELKLRAEMRTGLQQREDALREPILGWRYRPRLQYGLADSDEKSGKEVQQTALVGFERMVALGKLSFDLVD